MELLKGIFKLNGHPTAEADWLNLCRQNVHSIKALVNGGSLVNERQCRDLSLKLFKTVHSVEELFFHCQGSTESRFDPALKDLYRILEKAKLLVSKCCKGDWIREAIFQIGNAKDFQVILLELGLCYHAIYEQAKDMSNAWSFQHEDLRKPSVGTFRPAPLSEVHNDQDALKRRIEGLVDKPDFLERCLARYLLVAWTSISQQQADDFFDLSSIILYMRTVDQSTETWGKDRHVGHGASGNVFKSTWLLIPCAKKILHAEVDEKVFLKEAGILFRLNFPHVVKFFCCGNEPDTGDCFIAMELMEMSLGRLISDQGKKGVQFPYPVVVDIMVQIARGMCYLHGMGMAHRDLKPHNVVVNRLSFPHLPDQYSVKLVDFGLSKVKLEASQSNIMTGPGIGTTRYRAPEAHPDGPGRVNWFKADVYSFGSTCAHLLSLEEPFANVINLGKKYVELMNGTLKPVVPATCPEKLGALLNRCWDTHPRSRPSFTEICIQLEEVRHELLRGLLCSSSKMEFKIAPTSYDFIGTEVKEHSASWRVQDHDVMIKVKPTLDSETGNSMDERVPGELPDMVHLMWGSSSAGDVSDFRTSAFGESLPTIDEVAVKDSEHASISEKSKYFSTGTELLRGDQHGGDAAHSSVSESGELSDSGPPEPGINSTIPGDRPGETSHAEGSTHIPLSDKNSEGRDSQCSSTTLSKRPDLQWTPTTEGTTSTYETEDCPIIAVARRDWNACPPEVQDLVLARRPFREIFHGRAVCRSFRDAIKRSNFQQARGRLYPAEFHLSPLVFFTRDGIWHMLGLDYKEKLWRAMPPLPDPIPAPDPDLFKDFLVAGHEGLFCVDVGRPYLEAEKIYVCNPLTGCIQKLPPLKLSRHPVVLNLHVTGSSHYRVIAVGSSTVGSESLSRKTEVYDSVQGTWEPAGDVPGKEFSLNDFQTGVYCERERLLLCVGFLVDGRKGILAFDVGERQWRAQEWLCPFFVLDTTCLSVHFAIAQLVECGGVVYLFSEQEVGGNVTQCIDRLDLGRPGFTWTRKLTRQRRGHRALLVYPEYTCAPVAEHKLCIFNSLERTGVVYDMSHDPIVHSDDTSEHIPATPPMDANVVFHSLNPVGYAFTPSFGVSV